MFESDDYDQALSQLDFPGEPIAVLKQTEPKIEEICIYDQCDKTLSENTLKSFNYISPVNNKNKENSEHTQSTPPNNLKSTKRIILNSHFDNKVKRKFPGPAGLLTGSLEETKDESISHMEVFSQDVDYSPNCLFNDVIETPLWKRLIEDTKCLSGINSINTMKQQCLKAKLRSKKANIVIAVVEAIDRFAADPLITLRDSTGNIKCTLHRDAWNSFSTYIVSQYCAFVLYKPTVITTGNTCKKHYLNITLRNISCIYSSTVIMENEELPEGFSKTCEDGFTIIKTENNSSVANLYVEEEFTDMLEGLDGEFTEDM